MRKSFKVWNIIRLMLIVVVLAILLNPILFLLVGWHSKFLIMINIYLISPFYPDTVVGPTMFFLIFGLLLIYLLFYRKKYPRIHNLLKKLKLPFFILIISYIATILSQFYETKKIGISHWTQTEFAYNLGWVNTWGFPFQMLSDDSFMTDPNVNPEYIVANMAFYFVVLSIVVWFYERGKKK